jgi:hypothetical protein
LGLPATYFGTSPRPSCHFRCGLRDEAPRVAARSSVLIAVSRAFSAASRASSSNRAAVATGGSGGGRGELDVLSVAAEPLPDLRWPSS